MPQIANFQRAARAALAFALVLICLAAYLQIAQTQSHKNREMRWVDQSAYMDEAIKAYETRFTYTGNRNRMPMYPFLQALFYSPDLSSEAFSSKASGLTWSCRYSALPCLATYSSPAFRGFTRLMQ